MKLKMLALMISVLVSGCSYSLSDVQASKTACAEHGGSFSAGLNGYGDVVDTHCTIDGIRYSYNRSRQEFTSGVAE